MRRDKVARNSARACVPLLLNAFTPASVVDLGCGQAHWLSVWKELGVEDVLGVDGPGVRENSTLLISEDKFLEHDLTKNLDLSRTFDLALCLEVAEHLPPKTARTLVDTLTRLAPIVVFSAISTFLVI